MFCLGAHPLINIRLTIPLNVSLINNSNDQWQFKDQRLTVNSEQRSFKVDMPKSWSNLVRKFSNHQFNYQKPVRTLPSS